jgi:valyl-tRNA synthetase
MRKRKMMSDSYAKMLDEIFDRFQNAGLIESHERLVNDDEE